MRKHYTINDLTGKRAGTYTILKRVTKSGAHEHRYLCECDCGARKIRYGSSLIRKGKIVAQGCRKCGRVKGEFYGWERERTIWKDMLDRCHNKKDRMFKYYGARGIKVCKKWKNSFWTFTKDIGKIPIGMSIERINNDGNYTPKNCKLIPRKEQSYNRRNTVWITIKGKTMQLFKWLDLYDVSRSLYIKRRQKGMSPEEALTTPKKYIGMWAHLSK